MELRNGMWVRVTTLNETREDVERTLAGKFTPVVSQMFMNMLEEGCTAIHLKEGRTQRRDENGEPMFDQLGDPVMKIDPAAYHIVDPDSGETMFVMQKHLLRCVGRARLAEIPPKRLATSDMDRMKCLGYV